MSRKKHQGRSVGSEGKCVVVLKKQQLSNEEPKTTPETYLAVSSECQLYIDVDHLNEPESILSIYWPFLAQGLHHL